MPNDWTQATIKVDDGIELFYTRTGKGDKPALVLAHGVTDQGTCWHQLAEDLEADYDVIMMDAYGHGKSSRVDPKLRFDLSEDLHDFILALGLEKPGVIGHSMGAAAAAGFAARYPDLLACLALEDPPWSDQTVPEDVLKKSLAAWKKNNLAEKQKTVKELIAAKKKESPQWEEAILPEWAQAKLDLDPEVFDHYPLGPSDWHTLAKAIQVPTLIITGDNALGAIVTPTLGVEAVELMAHGEFGHISNAGHCVRYEQYQPYLTMVKLFLKRNLKV